MLREDLTPSTSQLLSYSLGVHGEETSPRKRLPNKVTTPRKGPLILQTSNPGLNKHGLENSPAFVPKPRIYTNPNYQQRPRHSLNKFPILNVQRPLDQIEGELGKLSCAELKESVQLMNEWQIHNRSAHLPPMMRYSHLYGGSSYATEQYTHTEDGPMAISITYTRHKEAYPQKTSHIHARASTYPLSIAAQVPLYERGPKYTPATPQGHFRKEKAPKHSIQLQNFPRPTSMGTHYLPSYVRPTIAPQGVRAVAMHRLKPLTGNTVVRGRKISTTH